MVKDSSELMKKIKTAYDAIDQIMGIDIVMLDISEISIVADCFIIASANNPNQLKAIANNVEQKLYENGLRLRHSEGVQSAKWLLLDFGEIIVHIFNKEEREYYKLERIWGDAVVIKPEDLTAAH